MPHKPTYEEPEQKLRTLEREPDLASRKEKQKSVADSRYQFLLSSFSSASPVIYTARTSGNHELTFVSENVINLVGYKASEFIDNSDFRLEHIHPADKPLFLQHVQNALRRGHSSCAYRFSCKNGGHSRVRDEMSVIRDSKGEPTEIVGCWIEITEGNLEENAIDDSAWKLHAIFNHVFQFIGLLTTDGILIKANKPALRFIGAEESDVYGKPFWKTLWWSHSSTLQTRLRKAIKKAAKGEFVRFETMFRATDGSLRAFDFSIQPVKDAEGRVVLLIPEGRDISERKKAEELLKKERDQAQKYLDIAGVMIIALDRQGHVMLINSRGCKILGYEEGELIGRDWFSTCLKPDDSKKVRDVFSKLLDGNINSVEYFENVVITKTGEERILSFHNTVITGSTGKIIGTLASGEDITDRKQVETSLVEEMIRNELILQTTMNGFLLTDMDGKIIKANSAASKTTGYTRKELVEMYIMNLDAPESNELLNARGSGSIRKGATRFETKLRQKNGTIRDIEVSQNYLKTSNQDFFFYFLNDITQKNKAALALKQRENQLEREAIKLEKINTALEVLLKKREDDKKELEEIFLFNITKLAFPYLAKLKKTTLDHKQQSYSESLESNLKNIIAPFIYRLSLKFTNLTQTEIQIADLIMQGKSNKEIAETLGLAVRTIESHRKNIRAKTGIINQKINLRTYLLSMQ